MTTYSDAIAERDRLHAETRALVKEHERDLFRLNNAISEVNKIIAITEQSDPGLADDYQIASQILEIYWRAPNYGPGKRRPVKGEAVSVFTDAIAELQRGIATMARCYYGVKQYEQFDAQYQGATQYGMGPRHGSIWFSIGLQRAARERDLTEAERLSCIRWLRAIQANPDLLP